MKELNVKIRDVDYHDFLQIAGECGLSVEEKIDEIIEYYLLIHRGRFKICRFYPDPT